MYTIAETYAETENKALTVPGSYQFYGEVTGRCAIVWISYAEKHGMDWQQPVVRFFENYQWVDTWFPASTATAERLAEGWANSNVDVRAEVEARLAA